MFIYWSDYPPTTNNLYVNVYNKGRIIAPHYRAWRDRCPPRLGRPTKDGSTYIDTAFEVLYYVARHSDKRRRDLANYEKALTDSLVRHNLIKDDSLMDRLEMQWHTNPSDESWKVKAILYWNKNG